MEILWRLSAAQLRYSTESTWTNADFFQSPIGYQKTAEMWICWYNCSFFFLFSFINHRVSSMIWNWDPNLEFQKHLDPDPYPNQEGKNPWSETMLCTYACRQWSPTYLTYNRYTFCQYTIAYITYTTFLVENTGFIRNSCCYLDNNTIYQQHSIHLYCVLYIRGAYCDLGTSTSLRLCFWAIRNRVIRYGHD